MTILFITNFIIIIMFFYLSFDLYKNHITYLNSLLTLEETTVQERLNNFLSATKPVNGKSKT